ncbi:J-domain-containing protein [Maliponia aquimaris]|uniref:DnaJ homologue subfamily C member 28 conserved domain-containing protein n=1 Tax=Maliponia aquimaris TaxID=1673631 RepID=A0A238K513_9RHOB|nr:DUF1992 domain-containing protein [Maliponia aquimaris]SMX38001.1 hypothetical protein MAA8898_01334 [Maliponia aquimaris]
MDHPLIDLINARIKAAEQDGAFDNLEGAGKPLPPCDDPAGAVFTRILRDSGAVPEAVALTRDLARLRECLRDTADRNARAGLIRDIALMETRPEIARRSG